MSSGINEVEMITPLDQPMDPLDNMTPEETKALEDWEEHFKVFPLLQVRLILDQVHSCRSVSRARTKTK